MIKDYRSIEYSRYQDMIHSVQDFVIKRAFDEFLEKFWSPNYLSGKLRHFYEHVYSIIKYLKSKLRSADYFELVDFERRFISTRREYKLQLNFICSHRFKNNLNPRFLHSFLKKNIEKL